MTEMTDAPFTVGVEVEYNGSHECPGCYGDGEVDCYECDGSGRQPCSACDGEGTTECCECGSDKECSDCDGSGYEDCHVCYGNGSYECEECYGGSNDAAAPSGWEVKPEHCGTEFISPPTRSVARLMADLRELALNNAGQGVSDCGFHIHLSINPLDRDAVDPYLFFEKWQAEKHERIYPLVPKGIDARHGTQWCAPIADGTSFADWQASYARYQELNPCSASAHGTLEIRLGGASENGDEMCAFLAAVVEMANECRYRNPHPAQRSLLLRHLTPASSPLHDYLRTAEWRLSRTR